MKEFIEAIAAVYGWPFEYGRADFHNLTDPVEQKDVTHVFLDPVEIDEKENDSGVVEKIVYSGSMMLLRSSDIDEEDYDFRYENLIKPIKEDDIVNLKNELRCAYEVTFDSWKLIEVINVLDYNFDGYMIKFNGYISV